MHTHTCVASVAHVCEERLLESRTMGELGKHEQNSRKQKCVMVLCQHTSWPLDDPKGFDANVQGFNEAEMAELANFWVTASAIATPVSSSMLSLYRFTFSTLH